MKDFKNCNQSERLMNVLCNFLLETVSLIVVEEVFGGHTESSTVFQPNIFS